MRMETAMGPQGAMVRVVIINFNGAACLPRCLAALAAQTVSDFEVVVVDNASTDGSADLPLPDSRFRWLRLGRNLGFAAGNNRGAEGFAGEWLMTLNPDAFAAPQWLERLLAAARRHPGATMLGSTQLDDADDTRLDGTGDCYFVGGLMWRGGHGRPTAGLPPEGEVFGPCAAAAAYSAAAFRQVGGFDESFFCYCEDVDLAFRLRLAGGRCVQVADAVVRHQGSAIAGRASPFTHYHSARNRLWLFCKNMPGATLWLLLPAHGAITLALLAWAALRGHGAPVWRGIRDGVAGLPALWGERRRVQAARQVPVSAVLGAMSWSPLDVLRRRSLVHHRSEDGAIR